MKCIVTGATGHIGNVLVKKMLEQNIDVSVFVLKNEKINSLDGLNVEYFYGDVRDLHSLEIAFTGMDQVFHLAGIIEIGSGNKRLVREVNVNGTKNVIAACKSQKVKRLIYTSSVHAIAEKPNCEIISETMEFDPKFVKGIYAKTKAEATSFVLSANDDFLETIIVHPSGVIGPYEYLKSNLGQLIEDCANKKIAAYVGGGYNFVDVRDVADGIIQASQKGMPGECYILAGHKVSVKELMKYVEEITGVKAPTFKLARWFAFATGAFAELYSKIVKQKPLFTSYAIYTLGTNCNFSIEKAKTQLGYSIRDIKDTLRDTVDWLEENHKLSIKYK
ncbi:MAG: SDR family oxidoreductase [Clostridia bacterium]